MKNIKTGDGDTNDNTFKTNMDTINRIKSNAWAFLPIKKVKREQIQNFLFSEREAGQSNSVIKKDFQMLKKAFDIAKYEKYIIESFFDGPYGIKPPKSLKKDQKTEAFSHHENERLLRYLYTHQVNHKNEYLLCFHTRT